MTNQAADAQLSKAELLVAMRTDCVTFFTFYLEDSLDLAIPEFHEDIWGELLEFVLQLNQDATIKTLKKLFAVPREHAKSTIAKLAVILFFKYTSLSFLLYVSKTQGHAIAAIEDILKWLDSPQEKELHGGILFTHKASATMGTWIVDIGIRDSMSAQPRRKRIILRAIGSLSQVRGSLLDNKRPDLCVLDDIEDLDNTTIELQPKLDRWLFGSLLKSFAKTYFVMMIGNMLSDTTILARLAKEPSWNPTVFGSIVKDKRTGQLRPLWDGRHTLESLLTEYMSYRKMGQGATWEAEMMNLTQNEIFKDNMRGVRYVPQPSPEDIEYGAIVLDPAFGLKTWHDDAAFTVHVKIRGVPVPTVVDSSVGKFSEEKLFDEFLRLSFYWGLNTWCIEANAAQKLLIPFFKLLMQSRHINEEAFVMLPVQNGIEGKGSKILAFRRTANTGSYGISTTQDDLVVKLGEYDPNSKKHDDLCDSAAYGLIIWEHYGTLIEGNGVKQMAMLAYGDSDSVGYPVIDSLDMFNY